MKLLIIIFVALVGASVASDNGTQENSAESDSDADAPTPELITKNNYTVETHHVTTEDGYILAMHRIPESPTSPAAEDKPVVLLMHGILASSADWVVTGPGEGLGYIMADAGYDVWMGNARGNTYSKNHTNLDNLTEEEFWHFDWHEIGYYDLPAIIDYILESTGQEKVIYIGHSQGTTAFFVMTSKIPEYNDKVEVMFALAPIAYVKNLESPLLKFLARFINSLTIVTKLLGINEILPSSETFTATEEILCNEQAITRGLCSNLLYLLFGFDPEQTNSTTLPIILGHTPAGSSTRQLIHYAQEINSGKFREYDHGLIENLIIYHSLTPPEYNLRVITVPVHSMYSDNDLLAVKKDVEQLHSELGNPIEMYRIPDEEWNHVDFTWGNDAKTLVYDHILTTIEEIYKN